MKQFYQWFEDTGEVSPQENDTPYAIRGIKSKIVNNDNVPIKKSERSNKLFGFKGNNMSFYKLMQKMREENSSNEPKEIPTNNQPAIDVLKAGLNIDDSFWDNFINVTSNAEGVAALLDIPKESVTGWSEKIRKLLDQVKIDSDEESKTQKSQVVSTGQTDVADSNGVETPKNGPIDTQLTP